MYLEGGPESTLYFSANGFEFEKFGSYETGFNLSPPCDEPHGSVSEDGV